MILTQFPLLASIAGGVFTPIFGTLVAPAAAPVVAPMFASVVAPAAAPVLASFIGGEIFKLIQQTGAVAQTVLVILLIFSIMSWSVILTKWSSVRRARAQSGRFLR